VPDRIVLVAVAAVAAVCVVVALMLTGADRSEPQETDPGAEPVPGVVQLDCGDRLRASRMPSGVKPDTRIGPVRFVGLPAAFRSSAFDPSRDTWKPLPGVGLPAIKVIAVVRRGGRARLVIPERQRSWLRFLYEQPPGRGVHELTLQGCAAGRSRPTQFNGGFAIDFAHAPRRGLCGVVDAWIGDSAEPRRFHLFDVPPTRC
jgi:hypothetical protein